MNPRWNPFWPRPVRDPVSITSSEAAKVLSDCARVSRIKKSAMLCELRREVRECEITPLGWRS